MIPSPLCALAAVLSSLAAVNGALIQREGTFTYLTPQPTTVGASGPTSMHTSSTVPTTSSVTSASSTTPMTTPISSVTSTQSTTSSVTPTLSATPSTTPTTSAASTQSSLASSLPVTPTTSASSTQSSLSTPTQLVTPSTPATPTKSSPTTPIPPITPTSSVTSPSTTPIPSKTKPTTTATATSTAAPGASNCDGLQQWQATFAYTVGNRVIFNGQLYTARQWTYDNAPPTHPDQWALVGTCSQPISNGANCNGVDAWQNIVAYTAGNHVTNQAHLWSAVEWSESNVPGDASGSWQDLGACA